MKTAVSIPNTIYYDAEKLANQLGTSRSQLYAQALASYLTLHNKSGITKKLNEVYSTEPSELNSRLHKLQLLSLPKEEW